MAICTTAFFLIFKSVWEYHYVMMLPAVSAIYLVTGKRWALATGVILGLPSLYALTPVLTGCEAAAPLTTWPGWFRTLHFAMKVVPTLLFFAACLRTVQRGGFAHRTPAGLKIHPGLIPLQQNQLGFPTGRSAGKKGE